MKASIKLTSALQTVIPYKMKYWRDYCLVKCIEKHFSEINIGNLNKIISYMRIKLQLGANFSVRV